jgi:hypothetical protein
MKSITRFWMPALAMVVAGLMGGSANAQVFPTQPGQIITCNSLPGPIVIRVGDQTFAGTSNGTGTFRVSATTAGNPATGAVSSVTYFPVAINATSTFANFGTITTAIGGGGAGIFSATVSRNPGSLFPARSSMTFPATGTVNGTVYTSRRPLTLSAPNVNSFLPFQNEPFTLDQPVDFVNDQGQVGFTLLRLDATFNN